MLFANDQQLSQANLTDHEKRVPENQVQPKGRTSNPHKAKETFPPQSASFSLLSLHYFWSILRQISQEGPHVNLLIHYRPWHLMQRQFISNYPQGIPEKWGKSLRRKMPRAWTTAQSSRSGLSPHVYTKSVIYVSRGESRGQRNGVQRPTPQSCLCLPTLLLQRTNLKREYFTSVFTNLHFKSFRMLTPGTCLGDYQIDKE